MVDQFGIRECGFPGRPDEAKLRYGRPGLVVFVGFAADCDGPGGFAVRLLGATGSTEQDVGKGHEMNDEGTLG